MPNMAAFYKLFAALLHATRHQSAGPDQIDVSDLTGVLSDEQDAGLLKGVIIDDSAIADGKVLTYVEDTGKVEYI